MRNPYAKHDDVPKPQGGFRADLGIYVRSKMEANFARYLEFLRVHGEIREWSYEPEEFWFPVKRGTRSYKPDFRVREANGGMTYYETKGYLDAQGRVKLARMGRYHSEVRIVVVDGRYMADVRSKLANAIPGWE